MHELETEHRHNNWSSSTTAQASAGVSPQTMEDLNTLLGKLSVGLSNNLEEPVQMADAVDLIDLPFEREVFDPPVVDRG